jgi:ABC-2 type transport system ATP-binding protein
MPAVEITGLEKRYRKSQESAVQNLNLSVESGDFLGLLGPNGAGKTTTLLILCGILKPTSGTVRIHDVDVFRGGSKAREMVGYVPQDIALYPSLTAVENLTFFGRACGQTGKRLTQRIDECLSMVGLNNSADRRIDTFSGGMKRRANLAVGLINNPRLLVLDEPTVGVDAQSRNVIEESLAAINRSGVTIIYATHYMDEVQKLCPRVAIVDKGRLIKQGAPTALIADQPECDDLGAVFLHLTGRQLRD